MSSPAVAKGLLGGGCRKTAAHSRGGERAAQSRGKTWVDLEGRGHCSFPGISSLQVGPSGDRGGNPVASPTPSQPPQPRGATRTAVLAVCLEFSLPSGTGSPQTASLALPQGRARGRGGELSASDRVSGRAAGVSGREWPPGPAFPAALTPCGPSASFCTLLPFALVGDPEGLGCTWERELQDSAFSSC